MRERHATDVDLLRSIDGELAGGRRIRIDRHLRTCGLCAARLGALQSTLAEATVAIEADRDREATPSSYSRTRLVAALGAGVDRPEHSWTPVLRKFPSLQASVMAIAVISFLAFLSLRTVEQQGLAPWRPDSSLTPGAVAELSAADLCAGQRPSRLVSAHDQATVLSRYAMTGVPSELFELDALITPELGGTTAPDNLWPQRYDSPVWNARVKDELENLLPQMVCRGQLPLRDAQRAIATDWIAAYRTFFKTELPIQHRAERVEDDDALVFEARAVAAAEPRYAFGLTAGRSTSTFAANVAREMY